MTEPKPAEEQKKERRIEREIEIAVPIEEVWRALTDGKELTRWFPLEARVTPGPDGKIFVSWGPDCEGEAEIVAWEPPKKFAWKDPMGLVEWTLESRGGKTIVRLLQSGFLGNADWENEWFDSTSYGWGFMLLSLQVALERHRGIARQVAWPRLKVTHSRDEAYRKLLSTGGVFTQDANAALKPGESYSLTTTTGESYSGRVEFVRDQRGFCLTIRELNDALLWFTIEGSPGKIEVQAWFSAFALDPSQVESFGKKWQQRLQEIFQN
ncbi:MAG: SRPBCC domain-containing protein [Candidatus Acidiferrum sp.]